MSNKSSLECCFLLERVYMGNIEKFLNEKAQTILRRFGISEVPQRIDQTNFFVSTYEDKFFSELSSFVFYGRSYKVGKKVTEESKN